MRVCGDTPVEACIAVRKHTMQVGDVSPNFDIRGAVKSLHHAISFGMISSGM